MNLRQKLFKKIDKLQKSNIISIYDVSDNGKYIFVINGNMVKHDLFKDINKTKIGKSIGLIITVDGDPDKALSLYGKL